MERVLFQIFSSSENIQLLKSYENTLSKVLGAVPSQSKM